MEQEIIQIFKSCPPGTGSIFLSINGEITAEQLLMLYEWTKKPMNVNLETSNENCPIESSELDKLTPLQLEELLKGGFPLNIAIDANGKTLAHYYTLKGNLECLRVVLKFNPDLSKKNADGCTPAELWKWPGFPHSEGHRKCLFLLHGGVHDKSLERFIRDVTDVSPEELKKLLSISVAPDMKDSEDTLAHVYCKREKYKLLEVLLEFDPDLDIKDGKGLTAMEYLTNVPKDQFTEEHEECMELLAKYTKIDYRDCLYRRAIITRDLKSLERVAFDLSPEQLRYILDLGFNINYRNDSGISLFTNYAKRNNFLEYLDVLSGRGLKVQKADRVILQETFNKIFELPKYYKESLINEMILWIE